MKRSLCILLLTAMMLSLPACGEKEETIPETGPSVQPGLSIHNGAKSHTYRQAVSLLSDHWNPHTCETREEDLPNKFLTRGLYAPYFNDGVHGDGGNFENFLLAPEMAAAEPQDITGQITEKYGQFQIPEGETQGYAYRIPLNPNAKWENGKPIQASTYVESVRRLLDPGLQNPRAGDMYFGEFCLAGAENYVNQGTVELKSFQELQSYCRDPEQLWKDYGEKDGILNWAAAFGVRYDFDRYPWMPGKPIQEEGFCLEAEDSFFYSGLSARDLLEFERSAWMLSGKTQQQADTLAWANTYAEHLYPETLDFSQVGILAEGDYDLILILEKPISSSALQYFLTDSWLVEPNLYDACIRDTGNGPVCSYGTSLDTTLSCGPYRMEEFESGKTMSFRRNENWYGYADETHCYRDPADGSLCPMFETDRIEILEMEKTFDQKTNFLKGRLSVYGLQPEDYKTYRNSESCYADPSELILNLILNGDLKAMQRREAAQGFDRSAEDLETITLQSFHRAISLSIDREALAAKVNPAYKGAYGLLSDCYISNPETDRRYRDTDQGRKALCNFYETDPQNYGGDLEAAAASVTGYDPDAAKEQFTLAFQQALDGGYLTDADEDGLSDQSIPIEFCINQESPMKTALVELLNEAIGSAARGTPFSGKIHFTESEPYGNDWYLVFGNGESDAVLAGWTGSLLNPYSMTELYTNGTDQYDGTWFDASLTPMSLELAGMEGTLTLSLRQWSQALSGTGVQDEQGRSWQFGELQSSEEQRLEILAALEQRLLEEYNYIPLMQVSDIHLLSHQLSYISPDYHPVMGRGGLEYLRYLYPDDEWADYVSDRDGELSY